MASEPDNAVSGADSADTSESISRARDESGHHQGVAHTQQALGEDAIALTMQMLNFLVTTNSSSALNLTDEQKSRLIDLHGRQSDQGFSLRKWMLVAGCFAFCLLLLITVSATVGLVVFLTLQDEIAFAREIFAAVIGAISGLFTGIGGTLGVIVLLRWWRQ